jgi:photosystem II stability/assembly factor-like uncharacterized protein
MFHPILPSGATVRSKAKRRNTVQSSPTRLSHGFAVVACLALAPLARGQEEEEPLPPGERGDRPAAAAEFWAKLHTDVERQVPEAAVTRAIEQVEALRNQVAQRAEIAPAMMAAFANRGNATVRIGGIPVGPLPAEPPANLPLPMAGAAVDLSEELQEQLSERLRPQTVPLTATVNPNDWIWLGPGNIGGRTRAIAVHPSNPQIMWLAGVAGGVWRTTDAGVTWAPLYDFMASLVVSCIALDPSDPNTLYVGTGEGFYNLDGMRGFGIFKSDDGGLTWEQLAATGNDDFRWVNRLAIAPDGETILAATRGGLFRSTDDGQTFQSIAVPMDDNQEDRFQKEVLDVRFHPTDSAKVVASGRGGNVFYSNDGGQTFAAGSGIPHNTGFGGRVELCYALADPSVVYASADHSQGELYRSTDGGQTYQRRSVPGHLSGQGWYANAVWAGDPIDPNLVVVGGLDLHRSANGGTTFTRISRWQASPTSAHADHQVIASHAGYDGNNNRTVFFGNDGGIYRADDVLTVSQNSGWQELNNGLGITQFYGAAGNLATGEITGGTQDNGTLLYQPSLGVEQHFEIFGGDGGYSAADPEDRIFYGEYVYLQIHRGQNGSPSSYIFSGIGDAGNSAGALFIAPFILDPNDANRMLAGGARLWRSNNVKAFSPSWSAIKPQFGTTLISAIAVAPGNSSQIWVGYEQDWSANSGAVFKTNNGQAAQPTWIRVDQGLAKRHCTRITIDPGNSQRAFATFGGYAADNLWTTTDGGQSWSALGDGSLPAVPNYDLAIHPDNADILILANEVGVFVSDDAGTTWSPTNRGPTNCAVFELFLMDHELVAATHGRGLFRIQLGGGETESRPPLALSADVEAVAD